MADQSLTPASVFAILLSLALVGGATIYYIKKKEEPEPAPPRRPPPPSAHAAVPPSHRNILPPHAQAHQPPYMPPLKQPQAFRQPAPPHMQYAPDAYAQPQYHPQAHPSHPQMPLHADASQMIAQVAALLRATWQQGVDDVTVLKTALQNPHLPDAQRQMAQQVLAAAGIEPGFPHHARQPYTQAQYQQQQMYGHAHAPPSQQQQQHWQDVGRAQPWQDFQGFGTQLGHWADEAAQWMGHPAQHGAPAGPPHAEHAPQQPVTYTTYPMPHEIPAAQSHEAAPVVPYGPTYWSDTARRTGLIKPGDRMINVHEAQHYLNTIGGAHLSEDGVLGDNTRNAIAAFQLGHHLPATGTLDAETSSALLYQAFVAATPQVIAPGF